jgi:hypothetical protein
MKYRIYYSHCGDAPTSEIFESENDQTAIQELERRRNDPSNGMDKLWMQRIDVEERVTHINA